MPTMLNRNHGSASIRARLAPRTVQDGPMHHHRSKTPFEIPSLNGIRALAVSIVFIAHAGINPAPGPLGVTIFFFLSGYLITTLLRMEFDRTGSVDLKAFYLRRAFRILPPLYIMLILADGLTLAGGFGHFHLRLGAGLSQVFFLSNYQIIAAGWHGLHVGRAPGTEQLWSLAVEEHFYLIYPFAYLMLRRYVPSARRQAAILAGICGLVLAWRFVMVLGLHASVSRVYAGTDTRIDSILFGCILGVVGNPVLDLRKSAAESWLSRMWAPLLAPVGLLAMALFYVGQDSPAPGLLRGVAINSTLSYTVDGLALFPLFVLAIRYSTWPCVRWLNARAVVFLGIMSYSIYISHAFIIAYVHRVVPGGQAVHGPVYLVVTLVIAWLMLRLVERPFARLRKRFSRATAPAPEGVGVVDQDVLASVAQHEPLRVPQTPAFPTGDQLRGLKGKRLPIPTEALDSLDPAVQLD